MYGETALAGFGTWVAADVAVPEPSDFAWPKWAGYALGGAALGGVVWATSSETCRNLFNEEKKGQTKPEVGTCPDCDGKTSNKPGKIATDHDLGKRDVEDKIHKAKNKTLNNNPDVEVCRDCGEIFPQTPSGGLGDSIGNIND